MLRKPTFGPPSGIGIAVNPAATLLSGSATICSTSAWLAVKAPRSSGTKVAVTTWVPMSKEVIQVALSPVSGIIAELGAPSTENWTDPLGVVPYGATVDTFA